MESRGSARGGAIRILRVGSVQALYWVDGSAGAGGREGEARPGLLGRRVGKGAGTRAPWLYRDGTERSGTRSSGRSGRRKLSPCRAGVVVSRWIIV